MNVAQKFGDKCETVSYLPIAATALYMLAATSVPDEARVEAITRAAAGETITKKKANQIIQQYTRVSEETDALGESLGLPTQGDSVLPQSDRIDDLTHVSPADVDDRPLAPPTQLQPGAHNYDTGVSVAQPTKAARIKTEDAVAPTPAQWRAAQAKHLELLQALRDAQVEIEQLTAENLNLHEANGNLHSEIAHLKEELAALKQ